MRRSHLVLAVILVAVVVLCVCLWVNDGPLWRLVMLTREPVDAANGDGHRVVGWLNVNRRSGDPHGLLYYYAETGMKYVEAAIKNDITWRATIWDINGKVVSQRFIHPRNIDLDPSSLKFVMSEIKTKTSPPWWFCVTDQTEPSAPWWNEKQ